MRLKPAVVVGFLLLLWCPEVAAHSDSEALPPVVMMELNHLDETYRILDVVSEKIWPGWTGYREVPFLFEYENGLSVLIGHPNPPKEFQPVSGVRVGKNQVFADRTELVAKELIAPLAAGGGPINFGAAVDGLPVRVVQMKFAPANQLDVGDDRKPQSVEEQVLIFIHELFHCFQRSQIRNRIYGNLQFNADANYALFSEIEGLALYRAYREPNPDKARRFAKEFLVARALKRAASMSDSQGTQESSDEFIEGTATYAEVRTLELLKAGGFTPKLTPEDSHYGGFRNADRLLRRYKRRLLKASADIDYSYGKSYTYGCFQALLSDRLFPGWQQLLVKTSGFIDKELALRLAITLDEQSCVERSIQRTYPVAEIRARNARYLSARDHAYQSLKKPAGKVYVIDFKATGQYLSAITPKKGSYSLGFNQLYPKGLPLLKFDEVEVSRITTAAEINQLYYIRTIDEVQRKSAVPVRVEGVKQSDGSWKDAVVRTPLFTLKAPRVRIQLSGRLVKIQVISRVR